ncbi:hypothetical protein BBJ28_00018733, partial [Nothophytophthora sp. Chile5]
MPVAWSEELLDYAPAPPSPASRASTVESLDTSKLPFSLQSNPLANASLPSIILAYWMQPIVSLGSDRVLELQDMWPICPSDSCEALEARFRRVYEPQGQHIFGIPPVAMAYAKTFRAELTTVLIGSVVYVVALGLQSYVAQALLEFLNDKENIFHISSGYWLLAMMTLSSLVAVCTVNYVFFTTSRIAANLRSLTMSLVFDKSLRLSSAARQEFSTGDVLTLMSVDAERVFTGMLQSPWHVIGPLAFVVSIVMIGVLLDFYAALAGIVVLVLVMTISTKQADRIAHLQRLLLEVIDERVKVTSEALQGIRVMKYYSWEESLAQRVEKLRAREMSLLRRFHSYQVINTVMLFLTPTFLSGVTLGVYVLIRHTLTIIEAFTLIAMVNICRTALFQLPQAISGFCKAKISLARIDAFLSSDEVATQQQLLPRTSEEDDDTSTNKSPLLSTACDVDNGSIRRGNISVRDANFQWPLTSRAGEIVVVTPALSEEQVSAALESSLESPLSSWEAKAGVELSAEVSPVNATHNASEGFRLEGVNLEVQRGSLVMIVGKVGAGKSSLISALLGEMPRTSG